MGKSDSLIGQVLHETYKITRKIGTGGMSDVFEAVHSRLSKKRFAIKVLHPDVLTVKDMYERFRREAEITTELGHPNIVEVVDFNEVPSGAPYIVMEHLDGEDLGRRIRRGGPMPPPLVVEVMEQVGSALAEAHRHGIVHRDMKPENVFLVKKHNRFLVKVLDFGISKIRHSQTVVTRDHTVFGTPHYMSPEQAVGEVREIDHTTDIFALAVICYQMLSGKLPFDAESIPDVLKRVCTVDPTPVHELVVGLPPGLSTVLLRAMAKRKQERYQKIDAFVADVGICLVGPQKRRQILEMTTPPASRVPHPTEFEATEFPGTEPPGSAPPPPDQPHAAKQGDTAPLVSAQGAPVTDPGGFAMDPTMAAEVAAMDPTMIGDEEPAEPQIAAAPSAPAAAPAAAVSAAAAPPAGRGAIMTTVGPAAVGPKDTTKDSANAFALEPTALATRGQAASSPDEASDTVHSGPPTMAPDPAAFSADDGAAKTMLGLSPSAKEKKEQAEKAQAEQAAAAVAKAVPDGASGLIEIGTKQEPTPSVFEEQPTVMLSPQEAPSTQQRQTMAGAVQTPDAPNDAPKETTEATRPEPAAEASENLHEMRTMLQGPGIEPASTAVTKDTAEVAAKAPELHAAQTMMLDEERSVTEIARLEQKAKQRSHVGLVIGMIAVVAFCVGALAYLLHDGDSTDAAPPDAAPAVAIDAAPTAPAAPAPAIERDAAPTPVNKAVDASAPAKDVAVDVVDAAKQTPDVAASKLTPRPKTRPRPRRPRRPGKKAAPRFTGDL